MPPVREESVEGEELEEVVWSRLKGPICYQVFCICCCVGRSSPEERASCLRGVTGIPEQHALVVGGEDVVRRDGEALQVTRVQGMVVGSMSPPPCHACKSRDVASELGSSFKSNSGDSFSSEVLRR